MAGQVQGKIGFGVDFQRSDGAGGWDSVGELVDITPPGISKETVDATHMLSPERWREFIAGLKDGGEFSIDVQYDPANATTAAFIADVASDDPEDYRIAFPGGTNWDFTAIATGFEPGVPMADKMVLTFTGKVTGKPGFVA